MRKILFISAISFFFYLSAFCQTADSSSIEQILKEFKKFEYEKVISLSELILSAENHLSRSSLIELYRMKGISHYSLAEEDSAKESFIKILQIRPDFNLDPIINSPKIIIFFQLIKADYIEHSKKKPEKTQEQISRDLSKPPLITETKFYNSAILRSMFVPGWGHLYLEQKTKGKLLCIASIAALIPSVYFYASTSEKEKDYLNETDINEIDSRYNAYNQAYRMRNIFITSFALIWLYTQFDILFHDYLKLTDNKGLSVHITNLPDAYFELNFTFSL